jgi:hypothetical protein
MKKILLLFVCLFVCWVLSAQQRIKVACVGNSITYGTGLSDRATQSYPVKLQKLLGERYEVENFGKPGATLLNQGHRPYTRQEEYRKALDFAFFLLKEPDELLEDRIRIAMDIAPKSDEGKKLTRSQAYRELKHYSLKESVPVYLDYQTMYLDAAGQLSYCDDIYKYDAPLLEALNKLNHKNITY